MDKPCSLCYDNPVIPNMQIQYYGDYCLKLTLKPGGRATEDVIIYTDLPEKGSGLRAPLSEGQIVLLSFERRTDMENLGVKGSPVVIDCPGEYSAHSVTILGLQAYRDDAVGATRGANTVYLVEAEELRMVYLGALGHELSAGDVERLGDIDILFVPIAGTDTLPIEKVDDLIRQLEPRVVIPIHYKINDMNTDLPDAKKFCASIGNCPKEAISKYTVRKKDLDGKNMEIVMLERA